MKAIKFIALIVIVGCMSSHMEYAYAESIDKGISIKADTPKDNSKKTRLQYKLDEPSVDKSGAGFINVSGKLYPKNSVGDFRRTESLNWRIIDVKPMHVNPFRAAPSDYLPQSIEKLKTKDRKVNLNKSKKKAGNSQKLKKK